MKQFGKILPVLLLAFLFLLFPQKTLAALYVNEFSSDTAATITDPDWFEIYNSGPDSVDLSLYRLRDNTTTNKKDLGGTIVAGGFASFDWSNKLNKTGDVVRLLLIADENTTLDQVAYGDSGTDVAAPQVGQSAGRQTDGATTWVIFSPPTKNATNNTSTLAPASTLTPTQAAVSAQQVPATPTPTKISTPTKTSTATITTKPTASPSPTLPIDVLGESTQSATIPPEELSPVAKEEINTKPQILGENNFAKLAISAGIILIISCGILVFRSYLKRRNEIKNI